MLSWKLKCDSVSSESPTFSCRVARSCRVRTCSCRVAVPSREYLVRFLVAWRRTPSHGYYKRTFSLESKSFPQLLLLLFHIVVDSLQLRSLLPPSIAMSSITHDPSCSCAGCRPSVERHRSLLAGHASTWGSSVAGPTYPRRPTAATREGSRSSQVTVGGSRGPLSLPPVVSSGVLRRPLTEVRSNRRRSPLLRVPVVDLSDGSDRSSEGDRVLPNFLDRDNQVR